MENTGTDDIGRLLLHLNLDQNQYKVFRDGSTHLPATASRQHDRAEPAVPESLSTRTNEKTATTSHSQLLQGRNWAFLESLFYSSAFHREAKSPATPTDPLGLAKTTIFGACGGVGTTTIISALGRIAAKSARGVLLVDAASPSLLPLHFGAHAPRSQMSTFVPTDKVQEGAIHIACGNPDDPVRALIYEIDCLYVDGGLFRSTESPAQTVGGTSIAVLVPDTRCIVELQRLQQQGSNVPYLLLNQFDLLQPLHREIQHRLARQFNDRLIPVTISHDPDVSSALAQGTTIIDYAPKSPVSEDLYKVNEWLAAKSAKVSELEPALAGHRP